MKLMEGSHQVLFAWIGVTVGCLATASAQQPAFPGAEGFGAFATGGRSGAVYRVTNLNNSGSGSFRDAVSQPNRTVVFDISGIIDIPSNQAISINRSNITIAGQTAPGDGITTRGGLVQVTGRNVIVRFLRCRPGDVNCPNYQDDSFNVVRGTNVVVDHVSGSWCNDEVLSVTHFSTNVTVQWCMMSEPLNLSCHVENGQLQEHGYGTLLRYGSGGVSFHHNLYAHCKNRMPRLGDSIRLDFVNNVVYNWGTQAGYNASDSGDNPSGYTNYLNSVGNFFVAGANTSSNKRGNIFDSGVPNRAFCQIHQSGNLIDTNVNGVLDAGDRGWAAFTGLFTTNSTRLPFPQVTTDTAAAAYVRVLSNVGASDVRDAVDARIVSNVMSQTGQIINSQNEVGGWPAMNSLPAPLDTDQDGMPDYWEIALGSSTNNAADRNDLMPDGYTRLEWYLNWLAAPRAHATNWFVNVDLRRYSAGLASPSFSVSEASNGTVALLGDGYTAQFRPAAGFAGLAGFQFVATGAPANLTGTVRVLVSPGAGLSAFEQWQMEYFGSTNNPSAQASADPDGDGMTNTNEFLVGSTPTNNLSGLRILSLSAQGDDVLIAWQTVGGGTNAVQVAASDEYADSFTDITGDLIITGSEDVTTNYTDSGGATNQPSRFYRIRLVP